MKRRYWVCLTPLMVWAAFGVRSWYEQEIVMEMGGTYEEMLKRSSARFSHLIPVGGYVEPKSNARLRFIDPQYGFVTPKAHFLPWDLTTTSLKFLISPHVEPLLLDDALKVVLDLQEQWRRGGWVAKGGTNFHPLPIRPNGVLNCRMKTRGHNVLVCRRQVSGHLTIHRFKDSKRPDEERYRISLEVGEPWVLFR